MCDFRLWTDDDLIEELITPDSVIKNDVVKEMLGRGLLELDSVTVVNGGKACECVIQLPY